MLSARKHEGQPWLDTPSPGRLLWLPGHCQTLAAGKSVYLDTVKLLMQVSLATWTLSNS